VTTVKLLHRYYRLAPPNEGAFEIGAEIEVDDITAMQLVAQNVAVIIASAPDPVVDGPKANLTTVDWEEENRVMNENYRTNSRTD
jgi:hypothetical protein